MSYSKSDMPFNPLVSTKTQLFWYTKKLHIAWESRLKVIYKQLLHSFNQQDIFYKRKKKKKNMTVLPKMQ